MSFSVSQTFNSFILDCSQLAVLILCYNSTGCDEMGDYFAIEADTMIDIVRVT